jgi:uncharacterized membrane protein YfcA
MIAVRFLVAFLVALGAVTGAAGLWAAGQAIRDQLNGRPDLARGLTWGLAGFAAVFAGAFSVLSLGPRVTALIVTGVAASGLGLWTANRPRPRPPAPPTPARYLTADNPDIPIEEVIEAAEWHAEHDRTHRP